MTHLYYATFLLALWVFKSDACLFPEGLNGTWYSSIKGTLNITNSATTTSISGWYFDKTEFGAVDLSCYTTSGDSYVFQSSILTYHGLQFYGYVCFILNRQSEAVYMYNIGSDENTDADNERIKTVLVSAGITQTVASVCDRTSYHTGSENILLKNDGLEEDAKITLPYQMRGTSWNYTFNGGAGDLCGTNSELNTCNSPDTSTLTFNYTMCPTIQGYSATGVLYLMYYIQVSNTYYMTMYNTDPTTDESTTYRFTCYIIEISGTTLYATQHPQECISTQNSTYVASPGATLVFERRADCPYDTSSTVLSTAATAGIIIAVLILIAIVVAAFLIWYYYKKRKEKEARDKLPLQKSQPANKKLANGELYKNGHVPSRESKTPRRMQNGDVKINMDARMDDIASIRREDSICLSMASRGPSVLPGQSETASRNGPAPVEEPEKVNESAVDESDHDTTLASTFLPISPAEKQLLNFSPRDIAEKQAKLEKEEKEIDMDDIDDELGLPRLSRAAFTPVIDPEPAPLPTLIYKKPEVETESEEERTKDGIKKVKLKKKKKKRVTSAKDNLKGTRPKSATKQKTGKFKEFPFLERIKKQESECNTPIIEVKPRAESEQSAAKLIGAKSPGRAIEPVKAPSPEKVPDANEKDANEQDANEKEVKRARSGKSKNRPKTGSKYLVDTARDQRLRQTDKGALRAPSSEQRRRFGDPPASSHRKRTPRLRHPMEIQGDGLLFETPSASPSRRIPKIDLEFSEGEEEKEIRQIKKEVPGKEERRTRSGRRRENPEGTTISSVKEDPFDHRDRPFTTSALPETRAGKSAGLRLEREHSAFIDPPKKPAGENVWNKASNMWIFKNQPSYGNIGK